MQKFSRNALKEWAAVVQALLEGRQLFVLRKGGIAEEQGEFQLAAREFFLYPTWEHQQESLLQPSDVKTLSAQPPGPGSELSFECYGVVTDAWPAPELSRIRQAQREFVWNEAFLEKRYAYKPHLPHAVMVLRVYRLPKPRRLPWLDRYAGCRSWVELAEALSTEGAKPVLEDSAFKQRRDALRELFTERALV